MNKSAIFAALGVLAVGDVMAQGDLRTAASQEIGITLADYKYKEPGLMDNKATKWGLDLAMTDKINDAWFARGELRYENGKSDYSGTGAKPNNPDWYYELRALAGQDIQMEGYVLAPYIGLGYRYLFNDMRGTSSTGAAGYRRENTLYYLPIGVTHRMSLSDGARLSTVIEYNHLLHGRQETKLSDLVGYNGVTSLGDASNKQTKGYGFKLSAMYETGNWIAGPTVRYWKIDKSENATVFGVVSGVPVTGTVREPKNDTTEIDVRVGYKF